MQPRRGAEVEVSPALFGRVGLVRQPAHHADGDMSTLGPDPSNQSEPPTAAELVNRRSMYPRKEAFECQKCLQSHVSGLRHGYLYSCVD